MNVRFSRAVKKAIAAVAAVASLGAMAACGNSTNASSGGDDNTLTFSYWDTFPVLEEFKKANPDIELKEVKVPGDSYNTKINQMILGNNAPDVMLLQEADYVRYAKNGVIDKLDDKLADMGVDTDDLLPAVKGIADEVDGYYGLSQGMATEIMYYNKDMFDAAGVAYPTSDWTWDDYAAAAQKLTKTEGGQTTQWGSDAPSFNGV